MKKYEAVFIIRSDEGMNIIKETIEKINNIVSSESNNIFKKEEIGEKKLAYEIKEQKKGLYYSIKSEVDDSKENVDGKISMKVNTIIEVIKHLIIRME